MFFVPVADPRTHNHHFYAFMHQSSRISSSQEQNLDHTPFVGVGGDIPNDHYDTPSPVYGEFLVASAGIVMVSPPESQDDIPQDVFHTPPEESSLPSSDEQRRETIIGVDCCPVNHAVDVETGTQGFVDFFSYSDGSEFVDLGRDSELGFSEAQLTQQIDVVEGSRDRLGEIPNCQSDEFRVLERELPDLGESPVKRSKHSEHNLGFGSRGDCLGVQLQNMEESNAENPYNFGEDLQHRENVPNAENEENCCKETSMDKNLDSGENFETQIVQLGMITSDGNVNLCESDKLTCTVEGNKSSDGAMEASGMPEKNDEEQGLRVLPSSIRGRLEKAGSESESEKVREKTKFPVFYVLKVLLQNRHEVEDNDDNVSLFETAKLHGLNFPRPRWWPDSDNFNQLD
ncbi:hypothetical protein VNO77_25027 [Canavalia gladiata]|uniref:Uncharacterized protein n=1 Tax=Canavalia gladiata TaxID=3824 RepID=A0AAN9LAR8_CANGL